MIDAFAKDGFDVFSGNEKPLIDNIKSGGAGCISATANINPGQDRRDLQEVRHAGGREAAELDQRGARRDAGLRHDPGAEVLHRPLRRATSPGRRCVRRWSRPTRRPGKDMIAKLDKLGFTMPGLKQAMAVAAE